MIANTLSFWTNFCAAVSAPVGLDAVSPMT
jgi:hypothetical protein